MENLTRIWNGFWSIVGTLLGFAWSITRSLLRVIQRIARNHPKMFFGVIGIIVFLQLLKNPAFFETSAAVIAIAIVGGAILWGTSSKPKKKK